MRQENNFTGLYQICVNFQRHIINITVDDYLAAWQIYRQMEELYPDFAAIDLIDGKTGEVFQSNREGWS